MCGNHPKEYADRIDRRIGNRRILSFGNRTGIVERKWIGHASAKHADVVGIVQLEHLCSDKGGQQYRNDAKRYAYRHPLETFHSKYSGEEACSCTQSQSCQIDGQSQLTEHEVSASCGICGYMETRTEGSHEDTYYNRAAGDSQLYRSAHPRYHHHIEKIVRPVSAAPDAKNVIFLSADAFGVLPPVSILTPEQAQYYFLSGFTSKLAGTERGITEPTPTFSACFGQAFLELHPTKYAEELVKKMEKSGAKAYLVNTGWNGTGKRISIKDTRGIIDAILDGSILKAETKIVPFFNLEVPTALPGVDSGILDPRDTYQNAEDWDNKAKDLAGRFQKNFVKYTGNGAGKALVKAGPQA